MHHLRGISTALILPPWLGCLVSSNQIDRMGLVQLINCVYLFRIFLENPADQKYLLAFYNNLSSLPSHLTLSQPLLPQNQLKRKIIPTMVSSEEDSINKHHPCGSVWDMPVYRRYRQGMSKVKRYTQGVDSFQLYWSTQHGCRPSLIHRVSTSLFCT